MKLGRAPTILRIFMLNLNIGKELFSRPSFITLAQEGRVALTIASKPSSLARCTTHNMAK
jgi:hypothetical protein